MRVVVGQNQASEARVERLEREVDALDVEAGSSACVAKWGQGRWLLLHEMRSR
jgi:hypothetical protein